MNIRIPRPAGFSDLASGTPQLQGLLGLLAGAATAQAAGQLLLDELQGRFGTQVSAELRLSSPWPELMARVGEVAADAGFWTHWVEGERELASLHVCGLDRSQRAVLEAWVPWLQPTFKRLAEQRIEREALGLAERQARLWRIKAELMALSSQPHSTQQYLAQATVELQRLLGARQAVFWRYFPEGDSLEACYYALPGEADGVPAVSLGLFQETVRSRQVSVASNVVPLAADVFLLGPVYGDQGLTGVFQVVLSEPELGGVAEEELRAACEVVSQGLRTVAFVEKLSYQASHDPLTGLANRRTFQATLEREIKLAKRHETPLSLVVVDVDHFKRYNDSFGHAAGDALLMELAHALSMAARTTDFVARFGGEEFVVILPHTDREGAQVAAQKLLDAIRTLHEHAIVLSGQVTASFGVATFGFDLDTSERLFEAADQAMYLAKTTGRNRICEA